MGEVAEHIPFVEFFSYLKTFKNVLRKNGRLLMTTPNPESFLVKLGRDNVLKEPSHINIMDAKFLSKLLVKLDYNNIQVNGCGKAVNFLGSNFPMLYVYGSYLVIAEK